MTDKFHLPTKKSDFHPIVRKWLSECERLRKERNTWNRKNEEEGGWGSFQNHNATTELSERDSYRFAVISALIRAIEAKGGRVVNSERKGLISFQIDGEAVTVKVVEKMRKAFGLKIAPWTFFPDDHQSGLAPKGLLRFTVGPYPERELVESDDDEHSMVFTKAVGLILDRPSQIKARAAIHEEECRQNAIKERNIEEARRKLYHDENMWELFQDAHRKHLEADRLRAFKAKALNSPKLIRAVGFEGATDDFSDWLDGKIDLMDPLCDVE